MPCGCGYCLQRVRERQNTSGIRNPGGRNIVCGGRCPSYAGGIGAKGTDGRNRLWGRNS